MTPLLRIVLLLALAAAPEPPLPDRLVARLGAESWDEREAAAAGLLSLGREAIPALERALESPDTEIRHRARALLDRLRWEPPGGLSDRLRRVMGHYSTLPERERGRLLGELTRELRRNAAPLLRQALWVERSESVRTTALRHLTEVDRNAAEAELRSLAAARPTDPWPAAALAETLASSGRTTDAIAAYLKARTAGAKGLRVTEALARLYTRTQKWDKARQLYAELVAESPDSGHYRLQLGRCYHMLGDAERAEKAWRGMLDTQATDPNAYVWLASAYEGIGASDKALGALRDGAKRHPQTFDLLRRLALALARRGALDEAVVYYERARAAARSPYQRRSVNIELTQKLSGKGLLAGYLRRKEAELERLDARIAPLLRSVAERHIQAGDRTAARKTLARLLALYPDAPEGRWAASVLPTLDDPPRNE